MRNTLTDGEKDILAELEIEARQGLETLEIPVGHEECDWCEGRGQVLNESRDGEIACPFCHGSGYLPELTEEISPEAQRGMARALAIIDAEITAREQARA